MKTRKGKVATEAKRRLTELQTSVPGDKRRHDRYPGTGRPFDQPLTTSPMGATAQRFAERLVPDRKKRRGR